MAAIPRFFQKIFGGGLTPGTNTLPDFGSLAAGTPTSSGNLATMQTSAWLQGWATAIIGNHSPTLQDFNTLFYEITSQLAYILQQGIPEWETNTTYKNGSFCQVAGVLYKSIQDNNTGHAVTDSSWWNPFLSTVNTAGAATAFVNFAGPSAAINNALNISAVTLIATGHWAINFNPAMADTNYVVVASCQGYDSTMRDYIVLGGSRTIYSFDVWCKNDNNEVHNSPCVNVAVFGT
jgi:hypothetical protein